jgi:hypothetical protein
MSNVVQKADPLPERTVSSVLLVWLWLAMMAGGMVVGVGYQLLQMLPENRGHVPSPLVMALALVSSIALIAIGLGWCVWRFRSSYPPIAVRSFAWFVVFGTIGMMLANICIGRPIVLALFLALTTAWGFGIIAGLGLSRRSKLQEQSVRQ